jgi:hypothetical protein
MSAWTPFLPERAAVFQNAGIAENCAVLLDGLSADVRTMLRRHREVGGPSSACRADEA